MTQNNGTPGTAKKVHNWRWILGLFFVFCGFNSSGDYDLSIVLFFIALGLGFIAWFFVPIIKDFMQKSAEKSELELRRAEKQKADGAKVYHCENCGAWSHGSVCEYCGSALKKQD